MCPESVHEKRRSRPQPKRKGSARAALVPRPLKQRGSALCLHIDFEMQEIDKLISKTILFKRIYLNYIVSDIFALNPI
jgi:hypothetical protein